jgi:hypothetical protein
MALEGSMTTRTTQTAVTFRRPFTVTGIEALQRAGTYAVETDEEPLPTWSPRYRRVATWIRLPGPQGGAASSQIVMIEPEELAAALAKDAEADASTITTPASPLPPERHSPPRPTSRAAPIAMNGFTDWCALNANELTWIGLLTSLAVLTAFFAGA